jgi:hypothetical protein
LENQRIILEELKIIFYTKTKISSIFMTYSELNFLLAEANQRNLIATESAKTYYDIAVERHSNNGMYLCRQII